GDIAPQMAIENSRQKRFHFRGFTLDLHLDSAVNEVFYPPNHFIPRCEALDGVSETDTLNPALVTDAFSNHDSVTLPDRKFSRVPFLRVDQKPGVHTALLRTLSSECTRKHLWDQNDHGRFQSSAPFFSA